MNPIQHIQLHENEFTKSEQKIMDYVLSHFDVISSFPISSVAKNCKVSKTALLRFCQKCGYRGYSEFKYEISRYLQSMVQVEHLNQDASSLITSIYIEQIQNLTTPAWNEGAEKLAVLVTQADHIKIYGIHETGLSCQYLSFRLATLGIDSEPLTSAHNMSEKASFSKEGDLNIFLTLSAKTDNIVSAIQCSLENHIKTVIITQNDHHKFKNKADLSLILPTFNYNGKNIFLDAQGLLFISIDIFINHLARLLHINEEN